VCVHHALDECPQRTPAKGTNCQMQPYTLHFLADKIAADKEAMQRDNLRLVAVRPVDADVFSVDFELLVGFEPIQVPLGPEDFDRGDGATDAGDEENHRGQHRE